MFDVLCNGGFQNDFIVIQLLSESLFKNYMNIFYACVCFFVIFVTKSLLFIMVVKLVM